MKQIKPIRQSLILVVIIFCGAFNSFSQKGDFQIIKERVVAELMKNKVEDSQVEIILGKMNEDGSFNDINYEDLSRTAGFPHRRHTSNLVYAAKAYKSRSSKYFKKNRIREFIVDGLRFWVNNDFFGDNWHNNQISTPTNLVNLMLLVGDELPEDLVDGAQPIIGRAHMNASGARPSGDRIVIAGILAKNLLFTGNKEKFDQIIELIEGEVKFSTGKRGMQHDYSFHHRHDRVNNTTSYGYGKYANAFGEWSYYVAGTKYAFSVEKINHLVDYYLDGIYKQMVYGIYTDISVKNRSITHKATFEPHGTVEIERLLMSTDYRKEELEEIMKLRLGETEPNKSFAKFFWQTEHFVFQRPGFYTTVRMFSTRNRNMEVPYNGPGKPTHHRADGTNYLQLKGDEYHNIWPVYDWQKISGATIVQKPELYPPTEIQKDGLTEFVGGVTDGLHGAAVFDFISPHDFVEAKKSWFFFDKEYLCLGAGINCDKNLSVATTINQVLMRGDVTISRNGKIEELPAGRRELDNVKWVYHDRVGYIFPEPTTINISNQAEQGRWSDITDQKNISDELISEDVFTMWYNHGERPEDASYQYMVFPDVGKNDFIAKNDDNVSLHILSNTIYLQAVESTERKMVQAAFYKGGEVKTTNGRKIKMGSQGMIMIDLNNSGILKLTVADPSRRLDQAVVTIGGNYKSTENNVVCIQDNTSNETIILVDLPKGVYAGKSISLDLAEL